ncbi:MAG: nucleotide exchange factor GrpE [Acidobacteria bacterium]|nr:nucleotide exchange factor GrpE [Acidobacteriota bacterium]
MSARKSEHDAAEGGETNPKTASDQRLDAAMREAVAAVEEVERRSGKRGSREIPVVADDPEGEVDLEELAGGGEVERLRREVAALKDHSLRTLADFDNFRKRSERERRDFQRYALVDPMREFLPVMDNLERALAAGGSYEDLKAGVGMIHKQMQELLTRFHVKPVEAQGVRFDPAVHDAVMREESEEVKEPTVTAEFQRGYMLHDRLLRPAMVKVAMPATPTAPEDGREA